MSVVAILMPKPKAGFFKEHILPTIICIGAAFAIGQSSWWRHLESNNALDPATQLRTHCQPPPDQRVVTVGIDLDSVNFYGRWPWNRRVHAQFMYALSFGNPAVMAWDILFTEKSNQQADALLQAGAGELHQKVVFAAQTSDEDPNYGQKPDNPNWHEAPKPELDPPLQHVEGDLQKLPNSKFALWPIPGLQEVGRTAFVDTPADSDGVRRHVPMLQCVNGKVYPSLSLQTLIIYWNLKPDHVRVVIGDAIYLASPTVKRRIPIDDRGCYFINYRFGIKGANWLGYFLTNDVYTKQYLSDPQPPPISNRPDIAGKILLIGLVAEGLADFGPTPLSSVTPLVLVHANVLNNILQEDYAKQSPIWPILLGAFGFGVIGLVFFPKRRLYQQGLYAIGLPVAYLGLATFLWIRFSLWIPMLWPVLSFGVLQIFMIVRQLVREQRAKQQIKGMFGTYLSPTLVNRMIESGQPPQLGGHKEDVTAYFSDIQSFSTFSEIIPPDQLVDLMNEYLTACTDILQEEFGTLDKYIGDAIVTIFGAPLSLPDHALRACVASQRIQLKLGELREKWRSEGSKWPEIVWKMRTRIGLNSGETIVGNIGSRTRFNYTMMGDNVNLAARMESGARSWGVYTMCSGATKAACEAADNARVIFRPLGRIVVKGRNTPVAIYEIVCLKENVTEQVLECIRIFSEGLGKFYARDWTAAHALFSQSLPREPNQPGMTPGVMSNPSLVYLDMVNHYQAKPPPESWDGTHVMREK